MTQRIRLSSRGSAEQVAGPPPVVADAFQPQQRGLLVATPILAGAVLRFAMGMLADRLSPKTAGLIGQVIVICALFVAWKHGIHSYEQALLLGLFTLLLEHLSKGRRLMEVSRGDLASLPEEALRNMQIGIRSADATDAIVELARQIGAVYPRDTIEKVAASLEEQRDVVSYLERLDFQPDYLHCHYSAILSNPSLVAQLARRGIGCNPWTPDDPDDLKKLSTMGCTGIITNRPDLLLEIQRQGGQFDE